MASACHRSFAQAADPLAKLVGTVVREMDAAAPDGKRDNDRRQYTHAFMDGSNPNKRSVGYNRGWMRLPDTHHGEFLDKMGQSIDCSFTPCVSERATPVRRAFADFDEETATSKDVEWQLTVARLWQKALRQCWPDAPRHVFTVCVLLRKEVMKEVTISGRTTRKLKNGMHLVAPNLYVSEIQLNIIRDVALRLLHDTPMLLEKGDGTWDKILDPKFDTLRMMGNCKSVKCKVCRNRTRIRSACIGCSGQGVIIDTDAVYELDHILNAEGEIDVALQTKVAEFTTAQKLKLTCIRTVSIAAPLKGFECPAFIEPRKRDMAMGLGDEEGDVSDDGEEKKKEVLEHSDPHFHLIEEHVQCLHPDYRHIRLREIKVVRSQRNKRIMYIATPWEANAYPCLNLVDCSPHNSEGIFFKIPRKTGQVFQCCNCKCPKGVRDGRVHGMCKNVQSPGQHNIVLPTSARLLMFDYPLNERRALLNLAEEETLTQNKDPWITGGEEVLMRMCMNAMGSPPILNSMEGEQQRNALTAFLRRAGGRKPPSIRQRKAAMERARGAEAEIHSRIVELASKIFNNSGGGVASNGVIERALQSTMRQEVGALAKMRGVQRGTHRFSQPRNGQSGTGAAGRGAFTKIDKESGAITFFPDRDNLEALRMREIREHGRRVSDSEGFRERSEAWKRDYAKFARLFSKNSVDEDGDVCMS